MIEYWRGTYGQRNNEFIEGVIAGIVAFAVWEHGQQVVGIDKTPLQEEIRRVKAELGWEEK